jgi:hypothetical protein
MIAWKTPTSHILVAAVLNFLTVMVVSRIIKIL